MNPPMHDDDDLIEEIEAVISHEDKRNHSHHQPHHSHHLHQDLLTLKISDIFQKKQDLIEVSTQETIQQVLSLFHLHRIHSLPVYEDHHDPFQRIYKGIVSIVDVLIFINRYQAIGNESPQDLFQQPIRKAIGATKESSNLFIQNDQSSLSVVIDKMCQGFHRCIVLNSVDQSKPAKLLTQTDIVKFFLDHLDRFPFIEQALKRPIEEILSKEPLLTTSEDELISHALNKLCVHSALPVLDRGVGTSAPLYGQGQIVANLSATDFVTLSNETNFEMLSHLTVREFLTGKFDSRHSKDVDADSEYTSPAVCITSKGSILTAALFMIEHRMHRVWVVAPSDYTGMEGYGIGCISLTDVLTTIALFSTTQR